MFLRNGKITQLEREKVVQHGAGTHRFKVYRHDGQNFNGLKEPSFRGLCYRKDIRI